MKCRAWMAVLAVALLAVALRADDDLLGAKKQFVTVAPVPPITVTIGNSANVEVHFRVNPGYHINSSEPRSELLLATKLKLEPVTDLAIGKLDYPAGEEKSFSFAPDKKLSVYTGDFAVAAKVAAMRSASPGIFKIHGELQYQACDDRSCYPPKTLSVTFEVKVVKPGRAR